MCTGAWSGWNDLWSTSGLSMGRLDPNGWTVFTVVDGESRVHSRGLLAQPSLTVLQPFL